MEPQPKASVAAPGAQLGTVLTCTSTCCPEPATRRCCQLLSCTVPRGVEAGTCTVLLGTCRRAAHAWWYLVHAVIQETWHPRMRGSELARAQLDQLPHRIHVCTTGLAGQPHIHIHIRNQPYSSRLPNAQSTHFTRESGTPLWLIYSWAPHPHSYCSTKSSLPSVDLASESQGPPATYFQARVVALILNGIEQAYVASTHDLVDTICCALEESCLERGVHIHAAEAGSPATPFRRKLLATG